jgi:hypothetical protein
VGGARTFVGAGSLVAALALLGSIGGAAAAAAPPANTAKPTISGTAAEGQTLTASSGSWSGSTPISLAYRWRRCDKDGNSCSGIGGATGETYTLTAQDVSRRVRVAVTATNSAGSASATSDPSAVVAAAPPQNSSPPRIRGALIEGSILTVDRGSWTSAKKISFAYAWQRCSAQGTSCFTLPKETNATYLLRPDDIGHTLRTSVTASNSAGSTVAISSETSLIAARGTAPVNTVPPTISGEAREGQKLTLNAGTWTGASPLTFAYQWQRCDAAGNGCAGLSDRGQAYQVTANDIGLRLRGVVTAKNSLGSTTAVAAATALVTSAAGTNAIAITSVSLPDRLVIDHLSFSPNVLHSRAPFIARFHVAELRGLSVSGALVYVVGVPFGRIANAPETATGPDGWVTIQLVPTARLPLVKGGALVLFLRARKPGENVLAGVSTRRLVQIRVGRPG